MTPVAIGLDPGKSGGIAAVSLTPGLAIAAPLPYLRNDNQPDTARLLALLREWDVQPVLVSIEFVTSFKMGRQSAFVFGQGVGACVAFFTTMGFPVIRPPPAKWMKAIGAGGKNGTIGTEGPVRRLFPQVNLVAPGCRNIHDGMVDALGIAEFTRQQVVGAAS